VELLPVARLSELPQPFLQPIETVGRCGWL